MHPTRNPRCGGSMSAAATGAARTAHSLRSLGAETTGTAQPTRSPCSGDAPEPEPAPTAHAVRSLNSNGGIKAATRGSGTGRCVLLLIVQRRELDGVLLPFLGVTATKTAQPRRSPRSGGSKSAVATGTAQIAHSLRSLGAAASGTARMAHSLRSSGFGSAPETETARTARSPAFTPRGGDGNGAALPSLPRQRSDRDGAANAVLPSTQAAILNA